MEPPAPASKEHAPPPGGAPAAEAAVPPAPDLEPTPSSAAAESSFYASQGAVSLLEVKDDEVRFGLSCRRPQEEKAVRNAVLFRCRRNNNAPTAARARARIALARARCNESSDAAGDKTQDASRFGHDYDLSSAPTVVCIPHSHSFRRWHPSAL